VQGDVGVLLHLEGYTFNTQPWDHHGNFEVKEWLQSRYSFQFSGLVSVGGQILSC
jgi:hypothetical protein